jgi:ribonuclease J
MVSLTFYGGVNEIGGNKILVENRDTRIFLDFGQSFCLLDEFFVPEAYLSPRGRFGLRDYFALNLIPKLDGLYSKEALVHTNLKYRKPEFDAVFLSHPHQDHFAHMCYLDPKIPIYMGEVTKLILDSTQECTRTNVYKKESKLNTFRTGNKVKIGSMKITPIHVDHSVPGAYGYIVDTGDARIVYSGDIRRHGKKPQMTEDFIAAAKEFDPDVLIMEGTRVTEKEMRKNYTEPYVEEQSRKLVEQNKGLTLGMRYPKDLDRFQTFYSIAKEEGKDLIISQKTANLLLHLKEDPINLPDPLKDKNIKILNRVKKTYKKWEKDLQLHCIGTDYIRKKQKDIILELDSYYMAELVDIEPKGGSLIHSMSEPFEEDPLSAMVDEVLRNWATAFNMGYHQLHASGHASKGDIFDMIRKIGAKKVFPVHTKEAELFRKEFSNTILPVNGKTVNP